MLPQKDFGDCVEACRYLTHESFRAREKYKYPRSDIRYSKAREDESKQIYNEMMLSEGVALLDTVRTVKACKIPPVQMGRTIRKQYARRFLRFSIPAISPE